MAEDKKTVDRNDWLAGSDIPADLFSVNEDGTKTDQWIMEELLGDDPVDPAYRHVLDDEEAEDA